MKCHKARHRRCHGMTIAFNFFLLLLSILIVVECQKTPPIWERERLINGESQSLIRFSRHKHSKDRFYPTDKHQEPPLFSITVTGKIPRIVWICSCQGISKSLDTSIKEIKLSNPNWFVIVHDCNQQRALVESLNDESLLLAYDLLNPTLHTARSDIW